MTERIARAGVGIREWTVQPEADALVNGIVSDALRRCRPAARFAERMLHGVGIRLVDILDHVAVPRTDRVALALSAAGFELDEARDRTVAVHNGGLFPDVLFVDSTVTTLAMLVESVADFLSANLVSADVEGESLATYRRACIWRADAVEFWVIERHGHTGFDVPEHTGNQLAASQHHLEVFRNRQREFDDVGRGFDHTDSLICGAVANLGTDWACALFLRAEREYWERRNAAGRLQKARQDALGIGWANDDHHTYDCSREWFHRTIGTLELLGFTCRERFYAGAEAGWGSQILEQPALGTVVFADIDLTPEELTGDFAHARLVPLPKLQRAGLWCALHGESMLEAGLNHLECMFDSAALREQLEELGVEMMAPFSNFPHLYQELTVGERWPVRSEKLDSLLAGGQITAAEAADFRLHGALGSHFENLERNQGFKGFNQPGISDVLRIIDPRKNLVTAPGSTL